MAESHGMRRADSGVTDALSHSTGRTSAVPAVSAAVIFVLSCSLGGRSHEGESQTGDNADLHLDE